MLVSSFCASRPRDATRRMSANFFRSFGRDAQNERDGAVAQLRRISSSIAAAAPSQQQLRCSSTTT